MRKRFNGKTRDRVAVKLVVKANGIDFGRNISTAVTAAFLLSLLVAETLASCMLQILIGTLSPAASRTFLLKEKKITNRNNNFPLGRLYLVN